MRAPVTAEQLVEARRPEDIGHSLWTTFQRVQENLMRGGQPGRSAQGWVLPPPAGEYVDAAAVQAQLVGTRAQDRTRLQKNGGT